MICQSSLYGYGSDQELGAGSAQEAKDTGRDLAPAALVAPMPSITPPKPDQVSGADTSVGCEVSNWVSNNPVLAGAGLIALYLLLNKQGRG